MLLVRLYNGDGVQTSRLSAADVKVCFDNHIPCYLLLAATDSGPEAIFQINYITDEEGAAGEVTFTVDEDGKISVS